MSENFPTFTKLYSAIINLISSRPKEILLIIFWLWATRFIIVYLNLPLPPDYNIDGWSHFSLINILIDLLFWASVPYFLYKHVLKTANKLRLILVVLRLFSILVVLTLILTALTLFFDSPFNKEWWTTGRWIWLKNEEGDKFYNYSDYKVQTRIDTVRGLPYDFYHRWTGYSSNKSNADEVHRWDFIVLEVDHLVVDIFFWFLISLIIARVFYYKHIKIYY